MLVTCPLDAFVLDLVEEGVFATAIQASVALPGERQFDLAVGDRWPGDPVTTDTLFSVWCATKPLLAVAVGLLRDQGRVDLDGPVRAHVAVDASTAAIGHSLRAVLNHTAPLARPQLVEIVMASVGTRDELIRSGVAAAVPGYSEVVFHAVIRDVLANVTGEDPATFVTTQILEPLGLAGSIRLSFPISTDPDDVGDVGFYTFGLPSHAVPLLHDRAPSKLHDDLVLLGGYASAKGLCGFHASVRDVLAGHDVAGLPSRATLVELLGSVGGRIQPQSGSHAPARHAGGFMVGLGEHGFSSMFSAEAFGHSGFMGASFAFHDPADGVSGGVISNGLLVDQASIDLHRLGLVRRMKEELWCPVHGTSSPEP